MQDLLGKHDKGDLMLSGGHVGESEVVLWFGGDHLSTAHLGGSCHSLWNAIVSVDRSR